MKGDMEDQEEGGDDQEDGNEKEKEGQREWCSPG